MNINDDYSGDHTAPSFTCTCHVCGSTNTTVCVDINIWADRDQSLTVEVVCMDCGQTDTPIGGD